MKTAPTARKAKNFIVPRAELARLLGCTPDRITKHVAEGMPVRSTGGGRGKVTTFDLVKVVGWLYQRRAADSEKTRYFRLQADSIEQGIRARAGELVEASDVDRRWAGMVAAARERLLSLPSTALQQHLITDDAEDGLIGLVDAALSELANREAHVRP